MLWRSDPRGKACNSGLTVACLDSRKSLQDNNIYIRNLPGHHPLRLGPFAPVLDSKSTVRPTTGSVRERLCRSRSLFPADYPYLVTNGSSSRSAARISASSDLNSPAPAVFPVSGTTLWASGTALALAGSAGGPAPLRPDTRPKKNPPNEIGGSSCLCCTLACCPAARLTRVSANSTRSPATPRTAPGSAPARESPGPEHSGPHGRAPGTPAAERPPAEQ
jgi:hypothetical protein